MIKYQVIKNSVVTNEWTSDVFGADHYEDNFGLPERWTVLKDGDSRIAEALDSREVEIQAAFADGDGVIVQPAVMGTEYLLPAQYQIVATDITAEHALDQATKQALQNQNIGASVIARVAAVNEAKIAAGSMTQLQFNALLQDPTISAIERLLWNGSLVTAKSLISSLDNTFYSNDEKNSILAMLP